MNKYINKALNSLNVKWDSNAYCTIESIENILSDEKQNLIDMEYQLQQCEDLIKF